MTHYPAQPYNAILDAVIANGGGGGLSPIATGTILGNGLGDTALPQALNANSIRTILGLATFNSPSFAGLTLTGLQSFSGTGHAGLRLNSLTSIQYGLLTPGTGDLFVDSTTDRIDARLARGTVELIDTAGGQTINGNVTLTGTVTNQGIRLLQSAGGTLRGVLNCPSWDTSYVALRNGTLAETGANTALAQNSVGDTSVGAASGRVLSLAVGGSVIGSVTSTGIAVTGNLTASGTVTASTVMLGDSTGPLLRNNLGSIEVRNNANSALSNFVAATITSDFCRTNTLQRNSVATITLFNGNINSNFHAVTIPGSGSSITNSSGIAGELFLGSTLNQTGTAGSTNLLINRTETALGSGSHNFVDFQVGGTSRFRVTNAGNLYLGGSTSNYYDNPTAGTGRWQTSFAGTYTFRQTQSGQFMLVQLETSEGKLAGLQHWDVAHANGRRLDLFSQPAVPITVRPANVLAMTWDTSGNTTAEGNLTASGTVRLGTYTVATLPSAAANTRATAYVTDSTVASFGAVATAGGALGVTVFSDGTNWIVSGGTTQPQKAITSGTAAPSGGFDGDIYLQYT